jgi:hypothetical protein
MLHATCTQGSQGDFWLLVVASQIANLIHGLFWGHNLCFNDLNGSHKPILDISVLKVFQWYKERFNPMGFDSWNYSLKIGDSIETPIPKVGTHLGVWGFIPWHFPTFPGVKDVIPKLPSWPAPLQALAALVASPRLGLRHLPSSPHLS